MFQLTEPDQDLLQSKELALELLKRYRGSTFEMLRDALLPLRVKIEGLDGRKFKASHFGNISYLAPGRTGKVVPDLYVGGSDPWREIAKGRVAELDEHSVYGELYHMRRDFLEKGLSEIKIGDCLEIDRFGVSSKLESALTEVAFTLHAVREGFAVQKMPENISIDLKRNVFAYLQKVGLSEIALQSIEKDTRAKGWPNFDFLISKNGRSWRVEVKSLWGTDTSKARLIHSVGGRWKTSSCLFEDQDVFAVNLWLRTGTITDFAFARSVLRSKGKIGGLPPATRKTKDGKKKPFLDYVNQNPDCRVGDGIWFGSVTEALKI